MNSDWQNSTSPFIANDYPNSKPMSNPLKIDTTNPFYDSLMSSTNQTPASSTYKPIPLPDDILGFDPIFNDIPMSSNQILQRNSSINNCNDQCQLQLQYPHPHPHPHPHQHDHNQCSHQHHQHQHDHQTNNNNSNLSFNFTNYIRSNSEDIEDLNNNNQIDNDYLDSNLNLNVDLEKVLLDLGISEIPNQDSINPTSINLPINNSTIKQNTHERKISGSAIFGFIGSGENTQLAIPGIEPVTFVNKKPLYKDITNFDNLNNIYQPPIPPQVPPIDNNQSSKPHQHKSHKKKEKPEYFVSSGNPVSYKFPPSPPRGTFETIVPTLPTSSTSSTSSLAQQPQAAAAPPPPAQTSVTNLYPGKSYPAKELQNLRQYTKLDPSQDIYNQQITIKSPLPTPVTTSPLRSIATSSPIKDNFQTPRGGSPKKLLQFSQLGTQTQFQIKLNKAAREKKDPSDETTILDDDKDKTISAITTPMKSKFPNEVLQTPTRINKFNAMLNNDGVVPGAGNNSEEMMLIGQRKNGMFNQRILKSPKRTPIRKKPTITSTLASGTLDKFFIGPNHEGKYICKFFDKELGQPCNREFSRISNVRAHIQTHLSDRPFVCHVCSKAFVRNHDLRRHIKGHSTAANVCPCGKTFPRSDALKRHRMRNICVGGISNKKGVSKPTTSGSVNSNLTPAEYKKLEEKMLNNISNEIPLKEVSLFTKKQPKSKASPPQKQSLQQRILSQGQEQFQQQNPTLQTQQLPLPPPPPPQQQPSPPIIQQSETVKELSQQQHQHTPVPTTAATSASTLPQQQQQQQQQQQAERPVVANSFFNISTTKDIDLFDFNEMEPVDNFSFNMDDSLVI